MRRPKTPPTDEERRDLGLAKAEATERFGPRLRRYQVLGIFYRLRRERRQRPVKVYPPSRWRAIREERGISKSEAKRIAYPGRARR